MRRFISTLPGRLVCKLLALAMIAPFLSFVSATRAEAQFQTLPTWAVVDFVNKGRGGDTVGASAAEKVAGELGKLQKYDVVPQETVNRAVETLGLQRPVTQLESLLRLAGELRASTMVSGEVLNWRVVNEGGGKRADVILRVVVRDAASGLPINGAALSASSSVRSASTEDSTLIDEALGSAAASAVRDINSRILPTATVLNTYEGTALINQGTRTGFAKNMELIIVRGRDQVAVGSVQDVEPDSSIVRITRAQKGVQPGDKVRAIAPIPDIKSDFGPGGTVQVNRPRAKGRASDFGTLAVVLGIVAILLGSGRSDDNKAVSTFNAEATLFPTTAGEPAVKLSWQRDLFARGNSQQVEWVISRSDVGAPVLLLPRNLSSGFDTVTGRNIDPPDFDGFIGGNFCRFADEVPRAGDGAVAGVVPGRPYQYSIQLVYKIAAIDLPDGGNTGSTGGTTGGTTGNTTGGTTGNTTGGTTGNTTGGTTGNTTGGTGGTGGGTSATECFFISPLQNAKGIATPLNRTQLLSPSSNATVAGDENFTFGSVVNPSFPTTIEYALQFSTDETFSQKNRIKTYAKILRSDIGTLAFVPTDYRRSPGDTLLNRLRSDFGTSVQQIFWRVGARASGDVPGPVRDASGERYVFGAARRMIIPTLPPPPPAE